MLNEDEHGVKPDDGTAYTECYDAIMAEVRIGFGRIVI